MSAHANMESFALGTVNLDGDTADGRGTIKAGNIADMDADFIPLEDTVNLSPAQQFVVDLAKAGNSFFFTGCAGTGKTFTLHSVIKALPPSSTFVTAYTGLASSLLPRGTTVHSFAGIGRGDGTIEQLIRKVKTDKNAVGRWKQCRTLVIDEVSMVSASMLETLSRVGQEILGNYTKPFGGIQVILSGDFYQLPPVFRKKRQLDITPLKDGGDGDGDAAYCFESPLWTKVVPYSLELLDVFRQRSLDFVALLTDVRNNTITHKTVAALNALRRPIPNLPPGFIPTLLVPHNDTADRVNMTRLREIASTEEHSYDCIDAGPNLQKAEEGSLNAYTLYPQSLPLKTGAQLMLLKNKSSHGLVNGSRGVVRGFVYRKEMIPQKSNNGKELKQQPSASGDDEKAATSMLTGNCVVKYRGVTIPVLQSQELSPFVAARFDPLPIVEFSNGLIAAVGPDMFRLENPATRKVRASRTQLPVRLAWAVTIHKSQGMTLDFAQVDVSKSFANGQVYVALSRARDMEGLQVLSFTPQAVSSDQKVADYYRNCVKPLNEETMKELQHLLEQKDEHDYGHGFSFTTTNKGKAGSKENRAGVQSKSGVQGSKDDKSDKEFETKAKMPRWIIMPKNMPQEKKKVNLPWAYETEKYTD